jgi:putative endonuclease
MDCYVYFLYSNTLKRYYVGISNDVEDRLRRHNNGESLSTKAGKPWKLLHVITCDNKSIAMQLEIKIKKRGIGRYLSDNNIIVEL